VLIIAAWIQIAIGLQPLEALRRQVARVRSGLEPRLAVEEPTEVMPLVAEVNSLLDAQDKAIEQARQRAADLAHGLKTPLQVLTMDAERLRARGEAQMAAEIEDLAANMRRHVGRELSRARLQPRSKSGQHQTPLAETTHRIVRALERSPRGRQLRFEVAVPAGLTVPIAQSDLMELLGNLLDNAVKWAGSEVRVADRAVAGAHVLVIEDDGNGVSPAMLASLGQRGVRLDESVEGTGLGLAIASDIADAYGARITFANRSPHGFQVRIEFPPV
jgi:signal transduction histidine kinase